MLVLRKEELLHPQLVGEMRVKVVLQRVQVEASLQLSQLLMAAEQRRQVVERYWDELQEQLVGEWSVKLVWQRVQVEASEQL